MMARIAYIFCFLMTLAFANVYAQTTSTTALTTDSSKLKVKTLTSTVVLGASSNLYTPENENHESESTLEGSFDYRFLDLNRLRLLVGATKSYVGGRETTLNDGQFSYLRTLSTIVKNLSSTTRLAALLPLNKETRELETKRTALTIGGSFVYDFSSVLAKGLSLTYGPSVTRNFHQYKTSKTYRNNTAYSIKNLMGVSYQIFEELNISLVGYTTNAWSYRGTRKNDKFFLEQNMTYSFTPEWSVTVGHNNGGDFFRPNGADSNVSVYDEKSSTIFFNLTASL